MKTFRNIGKAIALLSLIAALQGFISGCNKRQNATPSHDSSKSLYNDPGNKVPEEKIQEQNIPIYRPSEINYDDPRNRITLTYNNKEIIFLESTRRDSLGNLLIINTREDTLDKVIYEKFYDANSNLDTSNTIGDDPNDLYVREKMQRESLLFSTNISKNSREIRSYESTAGEGGDYSHYKDTTGIVSREAILEGRRILIEEVTPTYKAYLKAIKSSIKK